MFPCKAHHFLPSIREFLRGGNDLTISEFARFMSLLSKRWRFHHPFFPQPLLGAGDVCLFETPSNKKKHLNKTHLEIPKILY